MIRRPNSILVEIIRPDGYEDVHRQLVFEDMIESGDVEPFDPVIFEDDTE